MNAIHPKNIFCLNLQTISIVHKVLFEIKINCTFYCVKIYAASQNTSMMYIIFSNNIFVPISENIFCSTQNIVCNKNKLQIIKICEILNSLL